MPATVQVQPLIHNKFLNILLVSVKIARYICIQKVLVSNIDQYSRYTDSDNFSAPPFFSKVLLNQYT
jgi:hypothetical protein